MGVKWVISYRTSVRRFCYTAYKRSYNQKRIRGLKCPTFNLQGGGGGEDERRSEGEIAFFNDEVVLIPSEQTILGALF